MMRSLFVVAQNRLEKLNLENEDIEGIYPAVDFLSEITDMIETNKRPISLEGKKRCDRRWWRYWE